MYCMKGTWNTTIKSVCNVYSDKAFDRVDWTKVMMILQVVVDCRCRKWIWNLYNKQVAYFKIKESVCHIEVRQGCSLSLLFYFIYDEAMNREATDNLETGISVGKKEGKGSRFI